MISAVFEHLWQSTLLALGVWLLTLTCRKNRAQVRYALWFSASCKFLFPFSILTSLGRHLRWTSMPNAIAIRITSLPVAQFREPISLRPEFAPTHLAGIDWTLIVTASIWICGFATVTFVRVRDWRRIRSAAKSSVPADIPAPVEIRLSQGMIEPGVVGLLRPVLMLPVGISQHLTRRQLEAVLAHELCHIYRRDNLCALIHMTVEAIFWFHPLVWWIGARLLEERERACDERALSLGGEPSDYADAVVRVCRFCVESRLLCVPGVTGADLRRRVEAILNNNIGQSLNGSKKLLLMSLGSAAVLIPVLIGVMLQANPAIGVQTGSSPVTPQFEVASIRPCKVEGGMEVRAGHVSPGRLDLGCDYLTDQNNLGLIQRAYVKYAGGHRNPFRIVPIEGGPKWVRSEGYKIEAVAQGKQTLELTQGPMLQALLEDRFKLKIYRGTKDEPAYALVVAKGGPKLTPFQEGSCIKVESLPQGPPLGGQRYCDDLISARNPASINAESITLPEFCQLLNLVMDRPVIDQTGIAGKFDIHLSFWHDESTSRLPPFIDTNPGLPNSAGPSVFDAVRERLGLKLVPTKGPVEVLVIESVERPSAN